MSLSKEEMRVYYEGARKAVEAVYGEQEWISEQSFAHCMGFGGKCDLHSTLLGIVVDFKTKEFDENTIGSLKTWDNHHMQIAAYQEGLSASMDYSVDFSEGAICYVSSTVPGLAICIPISHEDLERGWFMFNSLLQYWKDKNKYESAFELDPAA